MSNLKKHTVPLIEDSWFGEPNYYDIVTAEIVPALSEINQCE